MFSRDEMQRAIEDALKTMEGVALELYRRGREEAREELETVKRERDEARAEAERYLADLRRCASEPYERTRELEALQAEVERLRRMLPVHPSSLTDACTDAYRRGAEAMRDHIAEVAGRNAALEWVVELVRAIPIPEDKP